MMKYLKSFKFWIAFSLVFYTLLGFVFIPWFLTNKTAPLLEEKMGLHVEIGKSKFNPYTFELILNDILLRDQNKRSVVGFKKIFIDYSPSWLLEGTILFKEISIDSPKLYTTLKKDGTINLENILPPSEEKSTSSETKTELPAIVLAKFSMSNGDIKFTDLRGKEPFIQDLGPYSFEAHDISTKEGDLNAHSFKTKIGKNGEIFWEGGMRLNPFSLYGKVQVSNLELPKLYAYAVTDLDAKLSSGTLSLNIPYQIDFAKEVQTSINGATLTLTNLLIEDEKPLIDVAKIQMTGFFLKWPKQDVLIENISVEDSKVATVLDENKNLNLASAFQSKSKQAESTTKSDSKPWSFLLKKADITKADITFLDKSIKEQFNAKLNQTSLHVKNISSQKESPFTYEFASTLNKNTQLKAAGNILQSPLSLTSNIGLKDLHVTEFLSYIRPFINFDIKSADVDVKATVDALLEEEIDFNLKADTTVKSLHVNTNDKKKLLSLEELRVADINYAHKISSLNIKEVTLVKPHINAYLNKDGSTNFSNLVKESKDSKKTESKPFNYMVKKVDIQEANVLFEDKTLTKPVKSELRKIAIHVKDISSNTKLPIGYKLSSILNKNTKLNFAGKIVQKPLAISSKIGVSNFHVNQYTEYIKQFINFDIKNADVDLKADIKAKLGTKTNFNIKADTSIKKLHIDGPDGEKLLTWKQLKINDIKYAHNPMSLDVKSLRIDRPYIRAHIDKDGSTNFSNLTKESQESNTSKETKTEEKSDQMKIKIGPMKLVNGTSDFSDFSLPFPFATHIHELNGDFSTLNFQTTTPSILSLTGKIDKYGYTNITGMLSPLNLKENANLNVLFKNIDLSSLTPYSGKFVGYKIKSGKLSMDLKYSIEKSKLVGDNKLNIDTLTLGETVESEDAVSLPLELAIALLKDSEDQIDINMPVSGDMDNPEFSYGSVIWGAVGNMITGIVTAPFKFLGAMLGVDGEELKSIDFDKGSYEIISTEHEKLENLQKILSKRPGIKLTIIGGYDEIYDIQAIQEHKLAAIMDVELKKIKIDKKATKTDTYGIVLKKLYTKQFTSEVYEKKKKSMLVDEKGKKIKFDIVAFNTLMQNELSNAIKVSKEELISLANQRANSIKTTLIDEYKIDTTRVTIKAPKVSKVKRERWVESALEIAI